MSAGGEAVTEDGLLGRRVRLAQPVGGYRAGIDPVMLAAFAPVRPGDTVLDAGAGVGAVSLCLTARAPDCAVVALERSPETVGLLGRSITLSDATGRVRALEGDLANLPESVRNARFDWVLSNPPFGAPGTEPREAGRRAARLEDGLDLRGWIAACVARVRPGGGIALVHRADRLEAVLAALAGRAGGLEILPLWPRAGRAAKRVLVRGRVGSRAPTILMPGLVLHAEDGGFTEAARAILEDAAPLAGARDA